MKKAPKTQSAIIRKRQARTNSTLLPALVAVGGGLGAVPATALELGGLNVQSTLGQPLRASIAYALGPNEALAEYCISLRPGAGMDGLPVLRQANIRVADGVILLTGQQAVREPLLTVRLKVDCPYTPRLTREYTLFVDPPGRQSSDVLLAGAAARRSADVSAPADAETTPQTVTRAAARTPAARPAPVVEGTRYRVQLGDTLSQIAAGIEDRPVGLWAAVNTIFEANPDAFIDNDPNRLKAGSWLTIPSFAETGETVRFAAEVGAADTAPEPADSRAYDGAVQASANAAASSFEAVSQVPDVGNQPAPAVQTAVADEPTRTTTSADDTEVRFDALSGKVTQAANLADDSNELMPGDVVLDENPYATAQSSADTASHADGSPALDWLWWLAGSGLALIGGLLMFGRGLRERFGAPPRDQVPAHPMRRSTDDPTRTVEVHAPADDCYAIGDDSPTEENLTLDADLVAGTGLSDGIDVEVNEDFALAASTNVDFELPEDSNPGEPETDLISPPERSRVESILESEVLPEEEDDYDMSVVMDATKMPDPADATERDFRAVAVDEASDNDKTDSYTINQEADYKILEQDYEDELTATQALNKEIERAAAELTAQLKNADQTADSIAYNMAEDEEATTEMQFANVTELDVTVNVRAGNDDQNDEGNTAVDATDDNTSDNTSDDNTSITARLTAEDKTVEMQAAATDKTVEIVSQDGDSTVEMDIESGRVNTKSGRG